MSNFDMIDKAVEIFKKNDCSFELILHICYPFDSQIANLNMIKVLRIDISVTLVIRVMKKGKLISLAICLIQPL